MRWEVVPDEPGVDPGVECGDLGTNLLHILMMALNDLRGENIVPHTINIHSRWRNTILSVPWLHHYPNSSGPMFCGVTLTFTPNIPEYRACVWFHTDAGWNPLAPIANGYKFVELPR